MTPRERLALASGVLLDVDTQIAIDAAARAGFAGIGLWVEPALWLPAKVASVRASLRANDVRAIDVEVVRMVAGPVPDGQRRVIEIAAELGAPNVLVVGGDDHAAMADSFAALCEIGSEHGVRIALEFMLFSTVPTLDDAREIVVAASSPSAALLIDPLHLDRAGYTPADVANLPRAWLPYAQFCDAPAATIPSDELEALLDEARHSRLLPGEGSLPLRALLDALPPHVPLSVELRSRALREAFPDPVERAAAVFDASDRFLLHYDDN